MKKKTILLALVGLFSIIFVGVGAYEIGKLSNQGLIADLQQQIQVLPSILQDAAVVKRVSKQMEDIAYQQKALSDKQRAKAEEQTILAQQMREKAEQEQRWANQARAEAQQNARHADSLRQIALYQMGLAEESKNEALYSKRMSDTASYRTLARSLAAAGMAQYSNGYKDQGRFLAYKAWEYTKRYDGNEYQPEIFEALLNTGEMRTNYSFESRGAVRGICLLGNKKNGVIAVTEYGDICTWEPHEGKISRTFMLKDPSYHFVDVYSGDKYFYALTSDGKIYYSNYTPFKGQVISLVGLRFQKIIPLTSGHLLIVGLKELYVFDPETNKTLRQVGTQKRISCVAQIFPEIISIFYEDGSLTELTSGSKLTPITLPINEKVTCCTYSPKYDVVFLGTEKGTILVIDKTGKRTSHLIGHKSVLTHMEVDDNVLITTSYDKKIIIWNLPKLQEEGNFFIKDKNKHNEWITLMTFDENSWPISLAINKKSNRFMVGYENGNVSILSYEVNQMANTLKTMLKNNLTREEWNQYVGSTIPYETILNK